MYKSHIGLTEFLQISRFSFPKKYVTYFIIRYAINNASLVYFIIARITRCLNNIVRYFSANMYLRHLNIYFITYKSILYKNEILPKF